MKLDERIVALRRERNLSQEQLAEALGVSRQAVAKWEQGESLPELPKVLALSALFRVSLDHLLRDDPGCSPAASPRPAGGEARIIDFLLRAKRATYAGHGAETEPSRPASHDLAYREDELYYHDTYLGGLRFAGEEAVWESNRPLWSMNYVGRVLHDSFDGDFLKEALAAVGPDHPYRGPLLYSRGEFTFHCRVSGSFEWFEGEEEIFRGGVRVYECRFHGGAVD